MTVNYSKKEIVLEALKQDGPFLKFASDDLKADKEIVLWALQLASDDLKPDKKITLKVENKNE